MQKTLVKTQAAALAPLSLWFWGWLFLLLPTFTLAAALPTVSRVKDINTTGGVSSDPQYIVKIGNITFFTAYTPTAGRELWKSDGTAAGTVMVKDIYAGSDSAFCGDDNNCYDPNFTAVGNMLYFVADNAANGRELWRSDGTTAGTAIIKDIYTGPSNAFCDDFNNCYDPNLTAFNNMLYFRADNGVNGHELWRTDGTAVGTVMVKDIYPGSGSSSPDDLTAIGTVLYFSADNGVTGSELWKSDGTAAGTVLVKDINPGSVGSYPNYLTAVGNVLYFAADDGVTGYELWKSDGTAAGTVLVKDINPDGSSIGYYPNFTVVNNVLYFIADNGVNGEELWKSDGTAAGTVLVKDINPGSIGSYSNYLTAIGTMLYFAADNGVTGYELWKSNGTAAGTVLIKDINPGSDSAWGYYDDPNFTAIGNVLYFRANNSITGYELWKSDGSTDRTVLVKDIYVGSNDSFCGDYGCYPNFTAVGTVLYFVANDGLYGKELWRSDGTVAGTLMVKDIWPYGSSSIPNYFTAIGNMLYFSAHDGVRGEELWRSDGTAAGTVMIKDIKVGIGNAFCADGSCYDPNFTTVNNILYFTANNNINGMELWRSDGTVAGTVMVKDIYTGIVSSFCDNSSCHYPDFTAVGNVLYFRANNGVHGYELWKTDGTAAGTILVKDIYAGRSSSSHPSNLTAVGSMLYFTANNGVHGEELWKSNGTAAGTVIVKEINVGDYGSFDYYPNFTAMDNMLYFVADNGVNGLELWKSDGTAVGTLLVKDIYAGESSSFCDNDGCPYPHLTTVGNVLYFRANNGVNGWELWKSDGTATGTVMVKDINAGSGSSSGYYDNLNFIAMGSVLYFTANNGVTGKELWKSDGTAVGTVLVKDIWPGVGNANPSGFTTVGNLLYFHANNGVNGEELWQTDGTATGTQMKELVPGIGGSAPKYLTAIGTKLYFSAVDNATGRELWRADIPNLFTVTPSANLGGLVTPNVPKAVAPNGTLKFTVTPLPYYNRNPIVGGTCPQGSWSASAINTPSVWTTGAITANCTVIFGFISTLPDFIVTAITLDPIAPVINGTFSSTITVKNQGPVTGDGKFLDVWNHQPVNQSCGAVGTKRVTVGTLTPGQSKTFNITSLPAGIAGDKTLRAFVDSDCGTTESNEGNNQIIKAYTMQ